MTDIRARDRALSHVKNAHERGGLDQDALAAPQARLASKLYRGLADPVRFGLLMALRDRPQAAGELAERIGLSPSRASNHLLCLLECGLVRVEPAGRRNVYRLADPAVQRLLDSSTDLLVRVGPLIEACLNYGAPTRRGLRPIRRQVAAASHLELTGAMTGSTLGGHRP
jgi:DNA-binding transcriptional ArsR family regulator